MVVGLRPEPAINTRVDFPVPGLSRSSSPPDRVVNPRPEPSTKTRVDSSIPGLRSNANLPNRGVVPRPEPAYDTRVETPVAGSGRKLSSPSSGLVPSPEPTNVIRVASAYEKTELPSTSPKGYPSGLDPKPADSTRVDSSRMEPESPPSSSKVYPSGLGFSPEPNIGFVQGLPSEPRSMEHEIVIRNPCGTDVSSVGDSRVGSHLRLLVNAVLCEVTNARKASKQLRFFLGNWTTGSRSRHEQSVPGPRSIGVFRRLEDKNLHHRKKSESRKDRRDKARKGRKGELWDVRLLMFLKWLGLAITVLFVCFMAPGYNPRGGGQHYPRQHSHIGDAGPPFVGTSTLKVPPAWSIERNHVYSLRTWISDLILWASATDIEVARQGPIAAMQITGSAKELVRELAPDQLAQGVIDQNTGQHVTGLMLLVRMLAQRYNPLDGEAQTRAVSDFLNFHRMPQESIDAFLVRYDVLRNRATMRGGLGLNHQGLAWLLLRALSVSADHLDRSLKLQYSLFKVYSLNIPISLICRP